MLPVDVVTASGLALQDLIAVQVCAGLYNRDPSGEGVFVLRDTQDDFWFRALYDTTEASDKVSPAEFLSKCLDTTGPASGYIRYNYKKQKEILPNLIFLAAIENAVLLEDGSPYVHGTKMIRDAVSEFSEMNAATMTRYMFDTYADQSPAMAKLNPGYKQKGGNPVKHELTGDIAAGTIDYVVKEKLFSFFMWDSCIPLTAAHTTLEYIVKNRPQQWGDIISVWGYDDSWSVLGGDFFEAETKCSSEKIMGQIASSNTDNLSAMSRQEAITSPLVQNPTVPVLYNKSKTYLALIIGDGDNADYVEGTRKTWMLQRTQKCTADASSTGCFPLLWTIQPNLLYAAPALVTWYYAQARKNGRDYFVLPPSGHLYAYPGEMDANGQAAFVKATERDAYLLNTSGTVGWEFAATWGSAMKHYFPRYAANNVVKTVYAVNVPYLLPTGVFGRHFYKIVGGRTIVFRPNEWRGPKTTRAEPDNIDADVLARRIGSYPRGTVTQIYVTSDGGADLDLVYKMVEDLPEHVEIVDHEALAHLALAAAAGK